MIDPLTTKRLVIRPYEEADRQAVVDILGNLEVFRWLAPAPHPFTPGDLRIFNPDGSNRWPDIGAITLGQRVIGGIGVAAHMGYYLTPEHWGKGYGTEAVRAAVDCGFDQLEFSEIRAGCFDGNAASFKILTGLGFEVESRGTSFCTALQKDVTSASLRLKRQTWEKRR